MSITVAIDTWLPYIKVQNIDVRFPSLEDNVATIDIQHVIIIKLFFRVGNENTNRSISFSVNDSGQMGVINNE